MVPVSVHTGEKEESMGNQVSAMAAVIHTDEVDPVRRLTRSTTQ
jgi:hypothetical protein